MRRFRSEIETRARTDRVWQVLTDLAGWSSWNTLAARCEGPLALGSALELDIQLRLGLVFTARAEIIDFDPGKALTWRGGREGLFHAVHGFSLEPTGSGCRIAHYETMGGVAVPLVLWLLGGRPDARYRRVNERLKQAVEAV